MHPHAAMYSHICSHIRPNTAIYNLMHPYAATCSHIAIYKQYTAIYNHIQPHMVMRSTGSLAHGWGMLSRTKANSASATRNSRSSWLIVNDRFASSKIVPLRTA